MDKKALKKYLKRSSTANIGSCGELLGSNEALKHFGKMWGEYKADTMMMLTSLEYEFIAKQNFTKEHIEALRWFIGNVGIFFKNCKNEHDAQIEKELKRVEK
jgi:hypothetical protein